jgi:N12 class adenine-specific DNA methylase
MTDFDTWAATFGETVTQLEMPPEGGDVPRQKSRFARFFNVPELLRRWHVSADIKTAEDVRLPVPALAPRAADGQRAPETIVVQPSEELVEFMQELAGRAEDIRNRRVHPKEDNMLKVSGDGRAAALDLRLALDEELWQARTWCWQPKSA